MQKKGVNKQNFPVYYKKSNKLIFAKGNEPLFIKKLYALSLTRIKVNEEEKDIVSKCTINDVKNYLGYKETSRSLANHLKAAIMPNGITPKKAKKGTSKNSAYQKSILDYRLITYDEEKDILVGINTVTSASYDGEKGEFEIHWNWLLRDSIYGLKNKFTLIPMEEAMSFKSKFSFTIFEMLNAELGIYKWRCKKENKEVKYPYVFTMNLFELQANLGIIDLTRAEFSRLKKVKSLNTQNNRADSEEPDYDEVEKIVKKYDIFFYKGKECSRSVLKPAKQEIEKNTKLRFEYKPITAGRGGKIQGYTFYVTDKYEIIPAIDEKKRKIKDVIMQTDPDAETIDKYINRLIGETKEIIAEELPAEDIEKIIEAANYNIERIRKAYTISKTQKITNLTGWMIKAIQDDYNYPTTNKSDGTQTEYDYEQLELDLLKN